MIDLRHFISAEALKMFLETKGWKLLIPLVIQEKAVFKPDFYNESTIIAQGKHGNIVAVGNTVINYQGESFDSPHAIIDKHGEAAIEDFDNWDFVEEMEWVIYKNGYWLHSFANLLELPKASKYRC